MAGIYSVELAFRGDANAYATCLGNMGFSPGAATGRYYTVGFLTADGYTTTATTPLRLGSVAAAATVNGVTCDGSLIEGVAFFVGGRGAVAQTSLPAGTATATTFTATAAANLDDTATDFDTWSINQAKVLTHIRSDF